MPRSVTVRFSDGKLRVYDNVPDEITPDQVEERARSEHPDREITEIAVGNLINRELRDAIATRRATVDSLQAIAQKYDYQIPPQDFGAYQRWIDYAAENPDVNIPDAIETAPVSLPSAIAEGFETGVRSVADTLTGAWAWVADRASELGITPTPANATRLFARLNAYSPEETNAMVRNLEARGLSWRDLVSAGAEAVRERPSYVQAQVERPITTEVSKIGAQIATTAPAITAAAARGAAAAGTSTLGNIFRSVGNAGIGTRTIARGTPAAANAMAAGVPVASSTAGNIGLRVVGGGTAGAAATAMTGATGEDTLIEGLIGGTIPLGATLVRRGVGPVFDLFSRRLGEVRAAEIFRNLIADNAEEIMTALREAPANARANVAEFLAERGLATPELAAATRAVTASSAGRPLQDVAQARAAGQAQQLDILRGGETGTEAVAATREARTAVRNATDPQRAEALFQTDIGRRVIIPAEREAERLDALAAEINNSGIVRRMRGLEGRSREQLDVAFQNPEFFTLDGPMARTGEIADQAGRRADEGIERQLEYRDAAAAQRQIAANLRAQGLSPLNIANVVGNLRAAARDAQYVNPARYNVLTSFADNLTNRARMMGGVIDASGLYELRKSMNDEIASLLGGATADPSALRRRTAELVGEIKPLIDDAIEGAGGQGWREYLSNFNRLMTDVERGEFGRRLADLPRARLERVLSGDDPDFVSDFFGPGRYDINAELTDVQRPAANDLLSQIGVDRNIAALGMRDLPTEARGPVIAGINARVRDMFQPGARNAFMRGLSRMAAGAPGVYGAGNVADNLARELSQTMKENAMTRLAPALANPAAALRLMPVRSANAMTAGAFDRMGPIARSYTGQTLQQLMNPAPTPYPVVDLEAYSPPTDQVFLGYQTGPNGETIPIYGPAGGL